MRLSGIMGTANESGITGRVFSKIDVVSATAAPSSPDESIPVGSAVTGVGNVVSESIFVVVSESTIDAVSMAVVTESIVTDSVSAPLLVIAAVSISKAKLDSIASMAANPAPFTNSGQRGLLALSFPTW